MEFPNASARNCLALLALLSCGGESAAQPPGDEEILTVEVPVAGTVKKGEINSYAVSVSLGDVYTVAVSDVTDDVDLLVFNGDGAYSQSAPCLIDHILWIGTENERCTVAATHTTVFITVDGSRVLGAAANYTIGVHSVTKATLSPSTPVAGTVLRGEAMVYVVDAVPGITYVATATSLTDTASWLSVSGNATTWSRSAMSPKEWSFVANDGRIYLAIDGAGVSGSSASYVIMATPAPVVTAPIVGTSGNVSAGIPTIGFVEGLHESFYRTDGMTPGEHRISVVGLTSTEGVGLRVFSDTLNTIEAACTSTVTDARECTIVGTSVNFSVRSGPENSMGAGYVLLVW